MKIVIFLLLLCVGVFVLFSSKRNVAMAEIDLNKKILVAFFSRTGEQYSVGNIKEGNTAIIAKMIADKTGADLFEIKVTQDNYPAGYDELTKYAKIEKQQNARPEIVGSVSNFDDYGTVFVGYPNWWADLPMPVYTFLEKYDFTNKIVIPFCTHEGSGLGGTQNKVQVVTKGKMLDGLGVYGHVAQNDRQKAEKLVSEWLAELGF